MSFLRKIFCCPRGNHRANTEQDIRADHPGGGQVRYALCRDCGRVLACRLPYGVSPWVVATGVPALPCEVLSKLGIVQAPSPAPEHPGAYRGKGTMPPDAKPPKTRGSAGGFHGGPIPGLGDLVNPSDPGTRAQLQEMLPQGAKTAAAPHREPFGHLGHGPAFDGRQSDPQGDPTFAQLIAQARGFFAEIRNRERKHEVRGQFKDHVYATIAETIALLGTCCRLKVGCVLLTEEGRVAGLGYNGAGPGMPHCVEDHCNAECRCIRTLHAEQNALFTRSAAPYTAYVTAEPCLACTKELALAGVRRVVYLKPYTSISDPERVARQEWIDHYDIRWEKLPTEEGE